MWKFLGTLSGKNAPGLGDLDLTSLTPEYNESRHGGYYTLLVHAIENKYHRNIALTGAYGAGKSSILQRLLAEEPRKTIALSLSTITPAVSRCRRLPTS